MSHRHRPATPHRLRAAGPQRLRGVASLLRLSQQAAPRLPSGGALTGWLSRAADLLGAAQSGEARFVAAVPGSGPDAMITRLLPRAAVR